MPPSSVFVSYAREDRDFAIKLAQDLRAGGVDVWMDSVNIRTGEPWDEAVEHALTACTDILVVLSPDAVISRSVMDELAFAIEESKRVLPVLHRACKIPFRIKRLQYADFTASYTEGISTVMSSLAKLSASPLRVVSSIARDQMSASSGPNEPLVKTSDQKLSWARKILIGVGVGVANGIIATIIVLAADSSNTNTQEIVIVTAVYCGIGAVLWSIVAAIAVGHRAKTRWAIGFSAVAIVMTWLATGKAESVSLGLLLTGPAAALVGTLVARYRQP